VNHFTEEPFWIPNRQPFADTEIDLNNAPINPETGSPFWNSKWEVEVMKNE
jgi:hypothetical protein